jgi:hypothetical protein
LRRDDIQQNTLLNDLRHIVGKIRNLTVQITVAVVTTMIPLETGRLKIYALNCLGLFDFPVESTQIEGPFELYDRLPTAMSFGRGFCDNLRRYHGPQDLFFIVRAQLFVAQHLFWRLRK